MACDARPSAKDRFIAKLADFLGRSVYREIVVHFEPVRDGAPCVVVANHFGGVSDALVLIHVLPRRPGIVARDVIWKNPVAGAAMNWVGGIPVHKPDDGGAPTANDQMFSSCYRALATGGDVLIFPEGVTRNEPSIAPIKTGAARIALGARASGVLGTVVVPVGIHYEDKAALRSRVFVKGGVPIDLDEAVPPGDDGTVPDANDRAAVAALTERINVELRRVAPDFEDWGEAELLTAAADVTLRDRLDEPAAEVPFGLRDRLANTLADRPVEQRRRICDAMALYAAELDELGLDDAQARHRIRAGTLWRRLVAQGLLGLILLPFAVVGATINVLPFLVVKAIGRLRVTASMLATVKPITAIGAYGIAWGIVIWLAVSRYGWSAGLAAFILLPVYFAATVLLIERTTLWWSMLRRHRRSIERAPFARSVEAHRDAVVEAVLV